MSAAETAAPELPPELAELLPIAAEGDAEIAGATALPGAPEAAAVEGVDEARKIAGTLRFGAMVLSRVSKPLSDAYGAEQCELIANEYLECAEVYGWTWHKNGGPPWLGLAAAVVLPAVMSWDDIKADMDAKRAARQAQRAPRGPGQAPQPPAPVDLPPVQPGNDGRVA